VAVISTTVVHLTAMRTPDLRDGELARVADMTERELRDLVDGLSAACVGMMGALAGIAGRDVGGELLRTVALEEAL